MQHPGPHCFYASCRAKIPAPGIFMPAEIQRPPHKFPQSLRTALDAAYQKGRRKSASPLLKNPKNRPCVFKCKNGMPFTVSLKGRIYWAGRHCRQCHKSGLLKKSFPVFQEPKFAITPSARRPANTGQTRKVHLTLEKRNSVCNNIAMKTLAIIALAIFAAFACMIALSGRYEIEVLGKSRDACLRLDKWTGKVELLPIDSTVYRKWAETEGPRARQTAGE